MSRGRHPHRLVNLDLLIAEAGSASTLARLAGTNPSYLSQIRRGLPTARGVPRGVGDALADKLERAMGKPQGWMDSPHVEVREDTAERGAAPRSPVDVGRACPWVSWEDAAHWASLGAAIRHDPSRDRLPCPIQCSPETFVARIEGESMAPTFLPDELVFVDPSVAPSAGCYVVVRQGEASTASVRQLLVESAREYLKAANPDWPERIVALEGVVIGVVIFKGSVL